jgi:D-aminopeptidase
MYNLRPGEVHHHASYLSGRHKPLYMMEGLDATFDAAFMVAYHGAIGAEHAILSHTYNRSLPAAASRPVKTTFSPGRSILIGVSADSRSFGPCRSNSSPTDRPARFAAARTSPARRRSSSAVPCEARTLRPPRRRDDGARAYPSLVGGREVCPERAAAPTSPGFTSRRPYDPVAPTPRSAREPPLLLLSGRSPRPLRRVAAASPTAGYVVQRPGDCFRVDPAAPIRLQALAACASAQIQGCAAWARHECFVLVPAWAGLSQRRPSARGRRCGFIVTRQASASRADERSSRIAQLGPLASAGVPISLVPM